MPKYVLNSGQHQPQQKGRAALGLWFVSAQTIMTLTKRMKRSGSEAWRTWRGDARHSSDTPSGRYLGRERWLPPGAGACERSLLSPSRSLTAGDFYAGSHRRWAVSRSALTGTTKSPLSLSGEHLSVQWDRTDRLASVALAARLCRDHPLGKGGDYLSQKRLLCRIRFPKE
jgi:hypothetical protein